MTRSDSLNFWWKHSVVKTTEVISVAGFPVTLVQVNPQRVLFSFRSDPGLATLFLTPISKDDNKAIIYQNFKASEVDFHFRVDRDFALAQVEWQADPVGTPMVFYVTEVIYLGD